jgi:hypothetical protein
LPTTRLSFAERPGLCGLKVGARTALWVDPA